MQSKVPDPVYVLRGSCSPVSSLDFLSTAKTTHYLASGTQEGDVIIWDLKIRGIYMQWKAHNSSVLWLKFINDSLVCTAGRSDSAIFWAIKDGQAVYKMKFSFGNYIGFSMCDYLLSSEFSILCTPGPLLDSVSIWDTNSCSKICCLKCPENTACGTVMQCKFVKLDSEVLLLIAYENGNLVLWEWSNSKIRSELNVNENIVSLDYDFVIKKGICGTVSENIFIFSISQDSPFLAIDHQITITNPGIGVVCSRPDSKIYAVGGWDYRLRLFSWKKHKPLAVLDYHKNSIQCISYSKTPVISFNIDGYLLAAGSCDNSISLWDLYNS